MVTAWRVVLDKHADHAFDGEGARRTGGRFNSQGTPLVYTSDSLALALLEVMVHVQSYVQLQNRVAIPVHFETAYVESAATHQLPSDWRSTPPPRSIQRFGDRWVDEARAAVLKVPSVIVPHAFNYLINPTHPDVPALEIGAPEALLVDERLIRRT